MTVSDDDLNRRLRDHLMAHGVYVQEFERVAGGSAADDGDAIHIVYETATPGESVPHREVGRVLNQLIDAHDDGWEPVEVHARVLDLDGDERGSWHAKPGWFRAFANGNISETDLSTLVLSTI